MNIRAKHNRFKYRASSDARAEWYADALLAYFEKHDGEDVPADELKARCGDFDAGMAALRRRGYIIHNVGTGGWGKSVRRSAYRLVSKDTCKSDSHVV